MAAFVGYCEAYAHWKEDEEIILKAWNNCKNTKWLLATSATGIHCPNLS